MILVDGGSSDGTVGLARKLTQGDQRFRIVEAGDATPGRGRNVGIATATHEWIALTDAGIRLDPLWLEKLLAVACRNPEIEVVYGNYEPLTRNFFEVLRGSDLPRNETRAARRPDARPVHRLDAASSSGLVDNRRLPRPSSGGRLDLHQACR